MSERIYNVLFLCTGNTARSILADRSCARMAAATSAPSPPAVSRRARSIRLRSRFSDRLDYPTDELRSKSWEEFARSRMRP